MNNISLGVNHISMVLDSANLKQVVVFQNYPHQIKSQMTYSRRIVWIENSQSSKKQTEHKNKNPWISQQTEHERRSTKQKENANYKPILSFSILENLKRKIITRLKKDYSFDWKLLTRIKKTIKPSPNRNKKRIIYNLYLIFDSYEKDNKKILKKGNHRGR